LPRPTGVRTTSTTTASLLMSPIVRGLFKERK
jgi:hypothetical protein